MSKHVPKCEMHGFIITMNELTLLYEDFQHYLNTLRTGDADLRF